MSAFRRCSLEDPKMFAWGQNEGELCEMVWLCGIEKNEWTNKRERIIIERAVRTKTRPK